MSKDKYDRSPEEEGLRAREPVEEEDKLRSVIGVKKKEDESIHPELQVLESLKYATKQFRYGVDSPQDDYLRDYDICITRAQKRLRTKAIFGPHFKWSVANFNLSLLCSHCMPWGSNISWSFLSPQNVEERLVEWRDSLVSEHLELNGLDPSASGHYICNWTYQDVSAVGSVTSLEVTPTSDLHVIYRKNYNKSMEQPFDWGNVRIFRQWTEWSECNKCDRVGKRHKFGLCSLSLIDPTQGSKWDALRLYADNTIPCSTFLNLYPELEVENENISALLEQPPLMLIEYCQVPCEGAKVNHAQEFYQLPTDIRDLYTQTTFDDTAVEDTIIGFIPNLSDVTLAEIACVFLLILFQAYVIYHICKHRQKKALKKARKSMQKTPRDTVQHEEEEQYESDHSSETYVDVDETDGDL